MNSYKNFPPQWQNIKVPTVSRAAMLAGIGTYTPCLPKGVWGQRAMWALVKVAGPRALPGKSVDWTPPLDPNDWQQFLDALRQATGPFDCHTVYERRRGREGLLMLLMRAGRPVGFVKSRRGSGREVEQERRALDALERAAPRTIQTPRVLGAGQVSDWYFVVTTAMPPEMHRMLEEAPAAAINEDIEDALAALTKPEDTPAHWTPFHGDFTPWNLRRFKTGVPWLIDWEDSGWAPPGADAVFYRASASAIGRPVDDRPIDDDEAAAYWRDWVKDRTAANVAAGYELRPLDIGLLKAFGSASG